MDDRKTVVQRLVMEDREQLSMTGVLGVEEFCDEKIVLDTELGFLEVTGNELKMNKLSVEDGELSIEGDIAGLLYTDDVKTEKGSFLSRLFR